MNKKQKEKLVAKYMVNVPTLTEFQTDWIRKHTAKWILVERDENKLQCFCTRCEKKIELGKTKHKGKATCPSCGAELEVLHEWRYKAKPDFINWVVIPRTLDKNTIMLRYVLVSRQWKDYAMLECARLVFNPKNIARHTFELVNGEWKYTKANYFTEYYMTNYRKMCCLPADPYVPLWTRELKKLDALKYLDVSAFDKDLMYADSIITILVDNANLWEKMMKVGLKDLTMEWYKSFSLFHPIMQWKRDETQLLKMLGINRTGMANLRKYQKLEILSIVKEFDLTAEELDIVTKNNITKYDLKEMTKYGLKKTIRYFANGTNVASWFHYITLLKILGYTLTSDVMYPKNFEEADRKITAEYNAAEKRRREKEDEKLNAKIKEIADGLQKATWLRKFFKGSDGLQIVVPETADELRQEGRKNRLNNCLASHVNGVANGKEIILFVRRVEDPTAPYVALEYQDGIIVQCMFKSNNKVTDPKIINFVEEIATKLREHNILAARRGGKAA